MRSGTLRIRIAAPGATSWTSGRSERSSRHARSRDLMSHDLTLWGAGTARTMRAHWMLLELGLEYEFHPLHARTGETQTDEFKRLNQRHKIPVLRHGSFVLTESAAIIQYLSETFTNSKELYVAIDARSRAT